MIIYKERKIVYLIDYPQSMLLAILYFFLCFLYYIYIIFIIEYIFIVNVWKKDLFVFIEIYLIIVGCCLGIFVIFLIFFINYLDLIYLCLSIFMVLYFKLEFQQELVEYPFFDDWLHVYEHLRSWIRQKFLILFHVCVHLHHSDLLINFVIF